MDRVAPFFRPGGTMDPSAPSYIERDADAKLLQALLAREYVFLLDSRQKGKSSMVARAIVKLREAGVATVKLDLQRVGANLSPEQWYAGLLAEIGQDLGLSDALFAFWRSHQEVGPLARWIGALHEVALAKVDSPVVVFIDEIDFVRALPFPTDEFFAGIRDCFNRRSEIEEFRRLTFCVVGVATPGQLIRNPEITPFNIGSRIDITDFSLDDTKGYARELEVGGRSGAQLMSRVHYWLNGHPYLTQLLCSQIASDAGIRSGRDVDHLVRRLFLTPEARQREPNFADVERRMLEPDVPGLSSEEKRTQVLELYGRVLKGKRVEAAAENPVVATLRLSGVGLEDRRALRLRNRLYGIVFDERWRRGSMPDAELRRQHGAARVALLRTAAVAGVVVLGVTGVALNTGRLARERKVALTGLQTRTKELDELSAQQSQTLNDLKQRTGELQQVSNQRQESLRNVKRQAVQLAEVSRQRAKALASLGRQNQSLTTLSVEKSRALERLNDTAVELRRQNYVGLMGSMQLAMKEGHWLKVARLLEESRNSPFRGWEWGHVAQHAGAPSYEISLRSFRNEFEYDAKGNVFVVSEDRISRVTPSGLTDTRKFRGPTIYPFGTRDYRAPFRAGIDPKTGQYVFRHAESDQIVARVTGWMGSIYGYNGVEKSISLINRDGKRERRTWDGGTAVEVEDWPQGSVIQPFYNGGGFALFPDGTLRRFDAQRRVIVEAQFDDYQPGAGYSMTSNRRNGEYVAVYGTQQGTITLFEGTTLAQLWSVRVPGLDYPVISGDGRFVLVKDSNSLIHLLDGATGATLRTFFGHRDYPMRIAFLPDCRHFASLDRGGRLRVWPVDIPPAIEVVAAEADPVTYSVSARRDRFLVGATQGGNLISLDLSTKRTARYDGKAHRMSIWAASDENVFVGTRDGRVERLTVDGLGVEASAKLFESSIADIFVLSGGKRLYVEEWLGMPTPKTRCSILDAQSLKPVRTFDINWPSSFTANLRGAVSEDGETMVIKGDFLSKPYNAYAPPTSTCIGVISASKAKLVAQYSTDRQFAGNVEVSPDGSKLYASEVTGPMTARSRIVELDARTLKETAVLQGPASVVTEIRLYNRGQLLVGVAADDHVRLWDVTRRKQIRESKDSMDTLIAAASPDGSRLVRYDKGTATLIDASSGEELFSLVPNVPLVPHSRRRTGATFFLRDGRVVVSRPSGEIFIYSSLNSKAAHLRPAPEK